jgi:hypothetical protein
MIECFTIKKAPVMTTGAFPFSLADHFPDFHRSLRDAGILP